VKEETKDKILVIQALVAIKGRASEVYEIVNSSGWDALDRISKEMAKPDSELTVEDWRAFFDEHMVRLNDLYSKMNHFDSVIERMTEEVLAETGFVPGEE